MSTLIRDCEIEGRRVDVRIDGEGVDAVEPHLDLEPADTEVLDAGGGALLPGLHDQHLHVLALAADWASVDCSRGIDALVARRDGTRWLRGVRAYDSVDRHTLDQLVPDRPVRVQHRSGGLWMLNSRALAEVADALDDSPDVERDDDGSPTGRLWRYDARLRAAIPADDLDLDLLAADLRGYGLTAVTDATPDLDAWSIRRWGRSRCPPSSSAIRTESVRGSCCCVTTTCPPTTSSVTRSQFAGHDRSRCTA